MSTMILDVIYHSALTEIVIRLLRYLPLLLHSSVFGQMYRNDVQQRAFVCERMDFVCTTNKLISNIVMGWVTAAAANSPCLLDITHICFREIQSSRCW